jgi:hypothetical protein
VYNHLPEVKPSGSKYLENIKIKNKNINLGNMHVVCLYCTITLKCTVQKTLQLLNFSALVNLSISYCHFIFYLFSDGLVADAGWCLVVE